ncbi:uncharacterized protein B0H64DRAFT_469519, partial [Chaetomium fimeti]
IADSPFLPLLSRPEFAIFDFAPGETHRISSPDALATARRLLQVLTVHCLDELGFDASDSRTHDAPLHSDLAAWCSEHALPLCGGEALFQYIWEVPLHLRPPPPPPSPPPEQGSGSDEHSYHGCCPAGSPRWHRGLSAGSAAYIAPVFHGVPFDYWVTALDSLLRFTELGNDLMSFSKEILGSVPLDKKGKETGEGRGMEINYITLQTLARRQAGTPSLFGLAADRNLYTYRDGLCELMDELVQVVREVNRAFVEYPRYCSEEQRSLWDMDQAARAWTTYKNGYIRMHLDAPRYSLEGLKAAVRDRDAWVRLKGEIEG